MIFPAIDLMDRRCVRLYKGDFNQRTDYQATPMDVAKSYAAAGAKWMHVVDLDGAKLGMSTQSDLIMEMASESGLFVQTGGGIRDAKQIKSLLSGGVTRVVIGSLAVSNKELVASWMTEFGADKIVLALDINVGDDGLPRPALKGWTEASSETLWDVIDAYENLRTLLVTDISKDGVLGGANVGLYQQIIARYPNIDLITSGGVGTLDHVRALKQLKPHGVIIGKALYENKFTLEDAIAC
jgi:phosphoribosylformimino-5-aminoimidazole carboxamide ribotide isomerase